MLTGAHQISSLIHWLQGSITVWDGIRLLQEEKTTKHYTSYMQKENKEFLMMQFLYIIPSGETHLMHFSASVQALSSPLNFFLIEN